jgi:hypothetical protein
VVGSVGVLGDPQGPLLQGERIGGSAQVTQGRLATGSHKRLAMRLMMSRLGSRFLTTEKLFSSVSHECNTWLDADCFAFRPFCPFLAKEHLR